jgi:hypothetical protein
MAKRVTIVGFLLLFAISAAPAQTPTPDAMSAARKLVDTLKLPDQYKALLPGILLSLKPVATQERPEMERDYSAAVAKVTDAYTPHLNAMIDAAAAVYANTFTLEELRDLEAFYRRPAGQKLLQKSQALVQQTDQIGQQGGQKAAEDLRLRLVELLKQKPKN